MQNSAATPFSIVIPVYNEEASIAPLIHEILHLDLAGEIIVVNDGSTDRTLDMVAHLPVRIIILTKNCGQSSALIAGILAASHELVVTLDGDGQNDPHDISKLIALANQADLVVGLRSQRNDPLSKCVISRIANHLRAWLLQDRCSDAGCSLKCFRRSHFLELPQFNGMHRFLPALFLMNDYTMLEIPVQHRARVAGRSKYTIFNRGFKLLGDLFGVWWLKARHISYTVKECAK